MALRAAGEEAAEGDEAAAAEGDEAAAAEGDDAAAAEGDDAAEEGADLNELGGEAVVVGAGAS